MRLAAEMNTETNTLNFICEDEHNYLAAETNAVKKNRLTHRDTGDTWVGFTRRDKRNYICVCNSSL